MAVHDLSLEIDHRNEPRPDVLVVRPDHANVSPMPVRDALLVVEVISPDLPKLTERRKAILERARPDN